VPSALTSIPSYAGYPPKLMGFERILLLLDQRERRTQSLVLDDRAGLDEPDLVKDPKRQRGAPLNRTAKRPSG
jgi:hypothetical protein